MSFYLSLFAQFLGFEEFSAKFLKRCFFQSHNILKFTKSIQGLFNTALPYTDHQIK